MVEKLLIKWHEAIYGVDISSKSRDGVNVAIEKYKDHPSIKTTNEKVSFGSSLSLKENV